MTSNPETDESTLLLYPLTVLKLHNYMAASIKEVNDAIKFKGSDFSEILEYIYNSEINPDTH